jgi:hypothetical protein
MEDNVQNSLWPFQICCDTIWPYQHAYYLSTSNEYLNDFVVYYINDILIFSKNMEDHECHVHLILEEL